MRVGDKEVVLELVEVSSGGGQGGAGQEEGLYGSFMSNLGLPAPRQGAHTIPVPGDPVAGQGLHPIPP